MASDPPARAAQRLLQHGRASYDRHAWAEAFEAFACAEGEAPLERDDLERLAFAAGLRGQDEAFFGALDRLYKACVDAQETRRAARAAFWIGFHQAGLGVASAAGWFARADRLLEHEDEPCAERGYLLVATVYRHLASLDDAAAEETAREALRIGQTCRDADLVALAGALQGRALLRLGSIERGLALLDEAMIGVTSEELSPLVAGIVYCSVIVSCQQVYALDRAREWTAALTRWCSEQPELVTFTGLCTVHRAEILQLGGAWQEAIEEVRQICERRTTADPEVLGEAWYQRGELLRLRGEIAEADEAYRAAVEHAFEPQPGLALLRLAQGQAEAAKSALRRVLSTTTVKWQRARLLPAWVEILLASGELDEARAGADELDEIARDFGTEILGAMAAHARGSVLLAEGDCQAAIEPLRRALGTWHRVGAPYLGARIRVILGRSYSALGDCHELTFPDDTFDVTGSLFGVMLVPNQGKALGEMVRVTKPGGRVLLVSYGDPAAFEALHVFIEGLRAVNPAFEGLPSDPPPLEFQVSDPSVLRQRLVDAGLRDVSVDTTHEEQIETRSGKELWDWCLSSNPIPGMLVSDLDDSGKARMIAHIDALVRARANGREGAVLKAPLNIGIGTK